MKGKRIWMAMVLATMVACGVPGGARAGTLGTDVIGMFPQNVGEFAYADLRAARALPWFPQMKEQMLPQKFKQFEQFLATAGVDPNVQVEELAWALVPAPLPSGAPSGATPTSEDVVGVALGAFRPETTEAYFRAQKLAVVKVREYSLYAFGGGSGPSDLFFMFIDANTAAFGQRQQLERMIAVRSGEQQGLLNDKQMMPLISQANGSGVVWIVLSAPYTRLAMQQLVPESGQFPQAQQLTARLRAMTIEIVAGGDVEARFEAVCATPDDANTFAALLTAGLMYQRYQVGNSNPDLAAMLDGARVTPAGDRLDVRLTLSNDQIQALIRRNTFELRM